MTKHILAQYRDILRNDLAAFTHRAMKELNAAETIQFNWHLEVIADRLEKIRRHQITRLIINIPPRQGKSLIGSVAYPAFALGHDPAAKFLMISHNQDLANDFANGCRKLMQCPFYQALFETRLSEERQTLEDFETTAGGRRISTSVLGGITGRGADFIIIDDPIKADDAQSDARRETVNASFYNTIMSRLNNPKTGGIVIIAQRLHADDLIAYVGQRDEWDVLSMPAIAEEREIHTFKSPYGLRVIERQRGEALHPARQSAESLNALRAVMSDYVFSAQYQQDPQPPEGLVIKAKWIKTYTPAELPAGGTIVQSWDTAAKDGERSDYSVCTTWSYHERHFFLLHVYRDRIDFPTMEYMIVELATRYDADVVLIEDRVTGTPLIQRLRHRNIPVQESLTGNDSKLTRLINQSTKFASGFVHVPQAGADVPWLSSYLLELTSFPNGAHDDQVDSTVHALAWDNAQLNDSFDKAMEWLRLQMVRDGMTSAANSKRFRVRILKASTFQLPTRTISAAAGEIIEVDESELATFTMSGGGEIVSN